MYRIKGSDNLIVIHKTDIAPFTLIVYIPNLITLGRIALVPLLVVLLQGEQFMASLVVFIIAGLSDALDGWIAKKFDAQTQLGAILDPLADKALLVSSYVMLSTMQLIPFWLMVVVVFRDLIIIAGYLITVIFYGSVKMQPLLVSKLNTFVQIGFIIVVLFGLASQSELIKLIEPLSYLVLVTSFSSGIAYSYIWAAKAMRNNHDLTARD